MQKYEYEPGYETNTLTKGVHLFVQRACPEAKDAHRASRSTHLYALAGPLRRIARVLTHLTARISVHTPSNEQA